MTSSGAMQNLCWSEEIVNDQRERPEAYLDTRPATPPAMTTWVREPFERLVGVLILLKTAPNHTHFILEVLRLRRHAIDANVARP